MFTLLDTRLCAYRSGVCACWSGYTTEHMCMYICVSWLLCTSVCPGSYAFHCVPWLPFTSVCPGSHSHPNTLPILPHFPIERPTRLYLRRESTVQVWPCCVVASVSTLITPLSVPHSHFPRLTWSAFSLPLAPPSELSLQGVLREGGWEWTALPALPSQLEIPKLAKQTPHPSGCILDSSAPCTPLYPPASLPSLPTPSPISKVVSCPHQEFLFL